MPIRGGHIGRCMGKRSPRRARFAVYRTIGAVVGSLWWLVLPAAQAAAQTPQAADQQCLGCHGMQGLEKKLTSAETLSLHVPADAFAKSTHGMFGCAACHADVQPGSHPPSNKDIKT